MIRKNKEFFLKKLIFILIVLFTFLLVNCSRDHSAGPQITITLEQAEEILLTEVLQDSIPGGIMVYELQQSLEKDSTICSWNNQYIVEWKCWFFFIDDYFYANWAHPCRYVLVNFYDESEISFKVIDETSPPGFENLVVVEF